MPITVFNVATGKEIALLSNHLDFVFGTAYSSDGKLLATASRDQSVKIWDTQLWHELATIKGHSNSVLFVAFSPDNQTLITAGVDKAVKFWPISRLLKQTFDARQHLCSIYVLPADIWNNFDSYRVSP